MVDPQRFPYKIIDSSLGMVDSAEPTLRERMPYLPIILSLDGRSLNTEGLLDTGASVNVLPLILGQANFFFEFDVCFFRARSEFEVRPKQVGSVGSDR